MRVEIGGFEAFFAELTRLKGEALPTAGAALYQEAESIMAASRPLVPVDLGPLRASGVVGLPGENMRTGANQYGAWSKTDSISVEFGYGGAAKDYALVQHERMDYRHTSGQAKFLEQPALEAAQGMGERLAGRVRKMFTR